MIWEGAIVTAKGEEDGVTHPWNMMSMYNEKGLNAMYKGAKVVVSERIKYFCPTCPALYVDSMIEQREALPGLVNGIYLFWKALFSLSLAM